ncbi:M18 family aminopeptidase [Aeromicrobium sp. YIM 150415]|uniref:M18 family aminopeptidase n=1 Tax=Aeromicrobium sp. YIM 150415 TaxID=2803912 RepID=UPI0019639A55|nr:M18 family aminopeptidase [Aeromicrobium sp. YIM 150415]MBM9462681.1 M18 family aminopeptidase [Aeromicrobium sp. YIM 150415]
MVTASAAGLCRFVDASPTPFHAVRTAAEELTEAGFVQVREQDAWPTSPGDYFVIRGGSLVAWREAADTPAHAGFRVIGAHTDSPNLRIKQQHDRTFEGIAVVALEPYGGPILESWFDRDLKVAGRLALRDGSTALVDSEEAVLRVPHLAIHLDRSGSDIDRQQHLNGIWSLDPSAFLPWLAGRAGIGAEEVLGWEVMTADAQPSALYGADDEFVAAPRLDNLATCYAGLRGFLDAGTPAGPYRTMLALFDHEEVGSTSERGAASDLLATTVERTVLAAGGARDDYHRAVAASICASGDMAHATHPNYADRHEPLHHITMGGGPVLKVNQNLRYATDAEGAAEFARACDQAGVPLQRYIHRADLPCGSTIGPMSAARTGMLTIDVGAPQLAMHAARETMAARDVELYARALGAFAVPAR